MDGMVEIATEQIVERSIAISEWSDGHHRWLAERESFDSAIIYRWCFLARSYCLYQHLLVEHRTEQSHHISQRICCVAVVALVEDIALMDEEVATHLLRAMLAIAAYRTATIPDLLIGLVEALELRC